jgi:hypothetical protein
MHQRVDGSDWGFWSFHIDNKDETPGNGGVDEGYMAGAVVFSFTDKCSNLPAGEEANFVALHFNVDPEAPVGTTEVRFMDGGKIERSVPPVENTVTMWGENVDPDVANSFVFVNGRVNISPDVAVFVRGDANGDAAVDISDAQRSLGYLFLGDAAPACYDAADANDDGLITISDAIYTLGYLFLGGPPLPPPFPEAGEDPTEDTMGCLARTE